jgi:hypothetical protein
MVSQCQSEVPWVSFSRLEMTRRRGPFIASLIVARHLLGTERSLLLSWFVERMFSLKLL